MEAIKNWFQQNGWNLANRTLFIVCIIAVGLLIIRIIMKIINAALAKSKLEKAAHTLIRTLSKTVLHILLWLIVASALGIDVTGIVALASVLTLAISLSLQDMLSNIIGGFTLLYTHPFGSGDYVEIGGQSGTVKEVGMTYTKLTTADNKVAYIPNKTVVSAEIVNYSVTGTRRASITVTASYDAHPQKVMQTLLSLTDMPEILRDPAPGASLTNYGDSSIEYALRFWTKTDDYWTAVHAVNAKIKDAFDENGIQMSYPHLNVHLDQ